MEATVNNYKTIIELPLTTIRKQAYSNILKTFPPRNENIDCGYSLEPPLTSTHNLRFKAEKI